MASITERLSKFLDEGGAQYEVLSHPTDYTAKETAADTHTPPEEFAKTVLLSIDGCYAMAVLPATKWVSFRRLRRALRAQDIRLATEEESRDLCPECDVGAAPPFGNLWGLPVYVSPVLMDDERITFNGGSHEDAIRMSYKDFERLVRPRIVPISKDD